MYMLVVLIHCGSGYLFQKYTKQSGLVAIFFFNFFLVFIHKYQMIFNLLEDNYYYYCIYIKEGLCKKE